MVQFFALILKDSNLKQWHTDANYLFFLSIVDVFVFSNLE